MVDKKGRAETQKHRNISRPPSGFEILDKVVIWLRRPVRGSSSTIEVFIDVVCLTLDTVTYPVVDGQREGSCR